MKRKTLSIFILGTILLVAGFHLVRAEDDQYESGDDEHEYSTSQSTPSDSSGPKTTKTVTTTQTIVVTPAQTVTEYVTQDVNSPDTDKDGIADGEDPHPNIAEIYIVRDDNNDGIVDAFEYAK